MKDIQFDHGHEKYCTLVYNEIKNKNKRFVSFKMLL